jgi:hypothetical protein
MDSWIHQIDFFFFKFIGVIANVMKV